MTKTDIIARLGELSALLGRDIDTSGTVAELEMRLLEAEEELASQAGVPGSEGGSDAPAPNAVTGVETQPVTGAEPSRLVRIRTTKTLQLIIFSKGRWRGDLVKPGRDVLISADDADAIKGIVIRV